MRSVKVATLFVVFLLLAGPALIGVRPLLAQLTSGAPVYFSVEPVALAPLTNINSSANGLETPATPSPVDQYFNVEIHLRGASVNNVAAGIGGVEVHLDFSKILAFAQVINFTNDLGTSNGVLTGPPSSLISAIQAGLYTNSDNPVGSPPYTGATRFEVASASTATPAWNSIDGLVAEILFQIKTQPSAGQQDFMGLMNATFSDVTDGNANEIAYDLIPGTVHIDAATTVVQQYYGLVVNVVGSGTVTQSPLNTTYLNGTVVTLTANPASGWNLQAWSGDVTGTQNPTTVTMNANKTVTATFAQVSVANYTLTVNVAGSGTVTESPSAASYPSGTVVTLTANPASGWNFQMWSGDVTGTQNPTTITLNADKTVTATFAQVFAGNYTLVVYVVGSGTVTETPAATSYFSGTVVTLTANSASGWAFQAWSGDVTGTQNPTTITMNGNKVVTVTFIQSIAGGKHDVAVTSVVASPSQVNVGGSVSITVEASNLGDFAETFDVTVYYDSNFIQTVPVASLNPHSSTTLTIEWNTMAVTPGVYTISASATVVAGDVNPENNFLADGTVTVTSVPTLTRPTAFLVLFLFAALAVIGGLAFTITLIAHYSKKGKNKTD